mmetsp:Transcript_28826/g.71871  ORF Transcript_28826/g.71871 Transcript_28826/m.71871 type:complete len:241 (-) Transcript_28826:2034-2756(-)
MRVATEDEDRAARSILGDQACRRASGRHRDDQPRLVASGSVHARVGHGFTWGEWRRHGNVDVCGDRLVEERRFRFLAHVGHDGHRFFRVVALGRLARQHHAVRAIEYSVRHIARLRTSGSWVERHRLEHLSRTDHWLPRDVALGDHHLLRQEHLRRRDLNAKIPSCHHHAVGLLQDLIEVAHPLVVLDLRDNADPLTDHRVGRHEACAHIADVRPFANERREDHVHVVLHRELQVLNVFL